MFELFAHYHLHSTAWHFWQYPVLSDVNKEAVKAYKVGSGMLGFVPIARMSFIVDKKGILRWVTP